MSDEKLEKDFKSMSHAFQALDQEKREQDHLVMNLQSEVDYLKPFHGMYNVILKREEKYKKIIKKLKESNDFYADAKNWQTPESQGFRVDECGLGVSDMIEEIDSRDSNCGGNLARSIKNEVKEMEKLL